MCQRVSRSRQLTQGLDLPGPPRGSLAVFAGHHWAWRTSTCKRERNAALVTGTTSWYKQAQNRLFNVDPVFDRRGRTSCFRTWWLVSRLRRPAWKNDFWPGLFRNARGLLWSWTMMTTCRKPLFVATDGIVVDGVAAWAAVVDEGNAFSLGLHSEDQSSHRAEVEGLLAVLRALSGYRQRGVVHVLADCHAALLVVEGGGATPLLASRASSLLAAVRLRCDVQLWWVPAHGKAAPASWKVPRCGPGPSMPWRTVPHGGGPREWQLEVLCSSGSRPVWPPLTGNNVLTRLCGWRHGAGMMPSFLTTGAPTTCHGAAQLPLR